MNGSIVVRLTDPERKKRLCSMQNSIENFVKHASQTLNLPAAEKYKVSTNSKQYNEIKRSE